MRAFLITTIALIRPLGGCKEQNPDFCPAHPNDQRCGGSADGGIDSDNTTLDAPLDAVSCYGAGAFEVCPMGAAMGTKTLSGAIDTNGTMCYSTQLWRNTQTNACFIVAANITVQDVTVTGPRPLVLVASGDISVIGHLDAASHVSPASEGPGSTDPGTCGTFGIAANRVGAGGGAGASFASPGAAGGNGGTGDSAQSTGGMAYTPFLGVPAGTLRAGCRGQQGGTGQGSGGVGGYGGGGVYVVAGARITLGAAAIVNASGAGAGPAAKSAGGGGGGSGGMIVLHAPDLTITTGAILVANGGSGSTGGDANGNGAGIRGNDPDPANPMTPAPASSGVAGPGGAGFARGTTAANGGNGGSGVGGGGGGGGGGYIQSNKALTNAKVSPTEIIGP